MTKRNPGAVVLLSILTFGLYAYYWLYATSSELKRESGRRDITPILDAFLALVTMGLWGMWAGFRNARVAHQLHEEQGLEHTDRSILVAAAGAATFVVGPWAWLVSIVLLQEDYNALAAANGELASEPAPRVRQRVRVAVDPPRTYAYDPAPAPRKEPEVEVFASNAPAPIAY